MASLKGFCRSLIRLPISLLKGMWTQIVKDTPVIKFMLTVMFFMFISMAVVKWTEMTVNILMVLVMGISINKTWFLRFIYIVSQSHNEEVIKSIAKRIADWLEKFSIAAFLPILIIALTNEDFIKNSSSTVFYASLIALVTFFCSLRITKHITEGLTTIHTRSDLRDIIRESEFHNVKFDFDELPLSSVEKMIEEYNSTLHLPIGLNEALRPILERQGLLKPAHDDSQDVG